MKPYILVADDDPQILRIFRIVLRDKLGWQVDTVADGRALLDAVAARTPDLIFTDIAMPDMDGIEAMVELHGQDFPIVAMSGADLSGPDAIGTLDNVCWLGATRVLPKPFTAQDVAVVAAELLDRSHELHVLFQHPASHG